MMKELYCANSLLDDRPALNAAWQRDGYWFFRDVLNQGAVARLRAVYVAELAQLGVIDPADAQFKYNGASLDGFPFRMEPLAEKRPWREFTAEAPIRAFFRRVLGDEPFRVTVEPEHHPGQ